MPVDNSNHKTILRCAVCGWTWHQRNIRNKGSVPQACPRAKCRTTRWSNGTDGRYRINDDVRIAEPEMDLVPMPTAVSARQLANDLAHGGRRSAKIRVSYLKFLGVQQEWHCIYCHQGGDQKRGPDGRSWHIDHVYPVSLGGDDNEDNLVLACATCNLQKNRQLLMDALKNSLLVRGLPDGVRRSTTDISTNTLRLIVGGN